MWTVGRFRLMPQFLSEVDETAGRQGRWLAEAHTERGSRLGSTNRR
jgi:hypothetical protein